jgi:hypothetical protein
LYDELDIPRQTQEEAMRSAVLSALALLAFVAAAAAGSGTDYDPKTDFSAYRTFAWKEGTPAPSSLTEDRLHAAVQRELEEKGLKEDADAPDLYVVTHVSVRVEQRVDVDHFGYDLYPGYRYRGRYYRTYHPRTTDVRVYEVPIGTLVVDLVDAKTNKLVWQGVISDTVRAGSSPEKRTKRVNKKVEKLFRKYPPRR